MSVCVGCGSPDVRNLYCSLACWAATQTAKYDDLAHLLALGESPAQALARVGATHYGAAKYFYRTGQPDLARRFNGKRWRR